MPKSEFYEYICAKECRNTHHKLVMNSLRHLKSPRAEEWRSIFVRYFEYYLQGSKDPDTKFKDFRNHVLHVSDNYWGGPVKEANKWYAQTVLKLKNENWKSAVYCAGVLSHYYMDPIMPLHTGQTEEEGVIHRACEWSINKSFDQLITLLENGPSYPNVELPSGTDWLKAAIHGSATLAHAHYQEYIDHYNLELGKKNPPAGLDEHLQHVTAKLLGVASVGFARVLERAFHESGSLPEQKSSSIFKIFYQLTSPYTWLTGAVRNSKGKHGVLKSADEFERTGKVIKTLPKDEKVIRKAHAAEVLEIDLADLDARPIGPVGSKTATASPATTREVSPSSNRNDEQSRSKSSTAKFRLDPADELERAPSIGSKTARRFERININTVSDFLIADPKTTSRQLNARHITEQKIIQWQTQTRLACEIPGIYGHDAQILVGCGFELPEEIAQSEPEMILSLVDEFAKTSEAEFILRSGKVPDEVEVTNWIEWSKQSRRLAG